jgi:tetratricopeptide (TPR) repeat protein
LRKAIRLDPKNIEARFWLAQCFYHDLCNYDESKKLLIQGLAIDPSRADCLEALAAIIEDTTQDYEESSNYLLKAIHYQPNWPNLRCYLASIYIKQKKLILAKQELDQAIILSQFPLKVPKSPIEDYYETIITGRANRNLGDSFIRLKKRILQLISV